MSRPPEIFKWRSNFFLSALLCGVLVAGCASLPKHASPWYDWRSSWLSPDMGQVSMTRTRSAEEAGAKATWAKRQRRPSEPRVEVRSRPKAKAQGPRSAKAKAVAKRVPPPRPLAKATSAARKLGLGDGSPPSEFLSAAKRLLGIRDGFLKKSFLRHLLSVAAIDVPIRAPHNLYAGQVFESLRARGHQVGDVRPGDLVFFRDTKRPGHPSAGDFTAAAVVESRGPDGVVVCIGWVLGEVRRFHMDPTRPHLRREEAGHRRINDVIRARSLSASGPALAGELFLGAIRLSR